LGLQRVRLRFEIRQFLFEFGQSLFRSGIGFLLQRFALDFELHDLTENFIELRRHGFDFGAQPGSCFIDEVNRLVGKESVGDIPMRQHSGGNQGRVLDADSVMDLITVLESAKNRDRIFDAWLIHHNRLKPPLQRRILFNVLPIFAERRRANTVQLAAGKHRLEKVARIIAPSALPAPTTVCSSSMKRMIEPCESRTSFKTAFRRSSNSPRYFAPAMSAPISRAMIACFSNFPAHRP